MVPGIDPKVDFAFKRVFGSEHHEPITIHLLNSVLQAPPQHRITSLDLLNPFSDKDSLDDKLSILDIKARDQLGRQFNVEMQIIAFQAFRPRVLYYWAKLHQAQLQEGLGYQRLRPTVSVCFVNTVLFPDVSDFHLVFELKERRHHFAF